MQLGFIGLGKMGANMTQRLLKGGHQLTVNDIDPESIRRLAASGAHGAATIEELAGSLSPPRAVWIMVPSGEPTEKTIAALVPALSRGDVVIDGGNSYYRDSVRRAARLKEEGLAFVDVGTSGGVWGLTEGYSLMIGGEPSTVRRLRPVFETLAPAPNKGWGHVGPHGAGHFVKMVHNGIEYGLMQAYAEGFAIMAAKKDFGLDLHAVAETWRHGSVVRSWLLDLTADALSKDPTLETIKPWVADSGEGRWTLLEALDLDVSAPVITESVLRRLRSREDAPFADKLLAALRQAFGGHDLRKE
ncbi:MAG TPA: decarboxylating 6-phosphogluconate dehydrogenase [Nitrospiria bacterium]|nr:decarboxylating 6-phosphogluconate dehydrogenase [Nitrospiria bacterium]